MKKFLHKLFFRLSSILIVVAVFIVIINVFAHSIINQVPVNNQVDMNEIRGKAAEAIYNNPKNLKTPQQKILLGMYRAFACSIIGQSCNKVSKDNVNNSFLGKMANVGTYAIKNPPASGVQEVYTAFANTGLAPNIYAAQGIGFGAITGFRPVWKIFRDIAYGLLVLVMVVISFMIMFRMKLNAQTAISIEAALPRIVLSLILITFSYAIAGFLIDAMYVVMGISITLLCGNNLYCNAHDTIHQYLNAGMGAVWNGFFPFKPKHINITEALMIMVGMPQDTRSLFSLSESLLAVLPPIVSASVVFLGGIANLVLVNAIVALGTNSQFFELTKNFSALTFSLGGLPPAIIGGGIVALLMSLTFFTTPLIITFIIFLTLIFLFFRIFFMLISTYLNILFYILLAPVMMLFEALPGQNAFSYWMRNMIGELLTFPLLAIFLMIGALIVNNFQLINPSSPQIVDWTSAHVWQPPFLSGWSSDVEQESFLMVIGMGIIFIIPDLIKMVKDMLGVKAPTVSIGLGTFLAGGAMAWGGGMGLLGSAFKWSGNIYGHDKEGRDKGLPGKLGKWFSPVKEMFVKRTKESSPQTAMSPEEHKAKLVKDFTTKYWDADLGDDPNKPEPKMENGNPVKRTMSAKDRWRGSAAGQAQTDKINKMAEIEYNKLQDDLNARRAALEARKPEAEALGQQLRDAAAKNQTPQGPVDSHSTPLPPNTKTTPSGLVYVEDRASKQNKDKNGGNTGTPPATGGTS